MGTNQKETVGFADEHKKFVEQVVVCYLILFIQKLQSRDATMISLVNERSQMTPAEQEHLVSIEKKYERAKDALENRIQLGATFEQVQFS